MNSTIRDAVRRAAERFGSLAHANPQLDAEVLLCHVLHCDRSYLMTWPERTLDAQQSEKFARLVARRAVGEPVAHLTGVREFWSLALQVSRDTLIPRPETELLVEQALQHMPADTGGSVADLGTGSGAIALALASERPQWRVLASDRSAAALALARDNAAQLGMSQVRFALGDWCEALGDEQFDLIVSNPPYVPTHDPHLQIGDVRFEPLGALVAGADGLDAIRNLARCARRHLRVDGWLLFEHGPEQGAACRGLLAELGYQDVVSYRDLGERERVSGGRWPDVREVG